MYYQGSLEKQNQQGRLNIVIDMGDAGMDDAGG